VQTQVEKQAKKQRQKTRWILAFRQTVPRSKVRAAKAMANWSGDDVLLLQNKNAPQFYDPHTLLRKVEDFRHPTRGDFVMKMKVGRRCGLGGRSMDYRTSVWRQTSGINTDTIEGFEPIQVDRKHLDGLRGLRQGAAATWDDAAEGVQVDLPTDGAAPILTGGAGPDKSPIFQLGCPELNRFGGITGWEASFAGTVHKVELWVQNPHYKEGERSLLDKVRGKNKPIKEEKSATKIKTAPKPKAHITLMAKGQQAAGMLGKILNKASQTPEHMSRQKLKTSANINKVCDVPACAFIRQPDGSVGFFVETCDDPRSAVVRSRVQPEEEADAIREIMANKGVQTKHVAKRLMTTMDAIDLKFEEASRALDQSVGRGQAEEHLAELRAQRDNDMRDLEAQAKATLALIERETEGHLARRVAHAVPDWVGSLLQESTAWQMLYPGRVPKKRNFIMDDEDAFDLMGGDDDDDFKKPDKPCTAPTTWPKFVQVVCLAQTKSGPTCSAEQLGEYKATYRQDIHDPPVKVEKVILTPMVVHRNLGIHYQRRLVEGWTSDEVMEEIHKYCGLPVVWRGCLPFTGGFHAKKLLNAWRVNWTLWTLLLAWLAWSYLSLREELPWGGIIGTMMTSVVLAPASKIQKGLILGIVVYLFLEGPALYLRYTNRFNPDFDKDAKYVALAARQKAAHEAKLKKQEDEDRAAARAEDEEDGIVRPENLLLEDKPERPPPVPRASARAMVAKAQPEKAYEAMHTGAALRELDKRKHMETTAVARRLVPKLDAETRRHEEELEQLEGCRSACTDSVAIQTLDAQKSKMEREYAARMKEIEADAMLALANVERAHDRAIETCTTNSTICEAPGQLVPYVAPPAEPEPERDEAAETAKLAAHQQAAMKIVAQHMIQQVDNVTSTHEAVMEALKAQLAPLGHTAAEDKAKRRAVESEIKQSERTHNEHLKTLEEKASVALSHVEQQHQQALAKLQAEFPKQAEESSAGKRGNRVNPTGGGAKAGHGRYDYNEEELAAQNEAARNAEALLEWSQLEDAKKATMRATAERLMAEMHDAQEMHDRVMAAAKERVGHATTDVARALFTDDIRLHEEKHAKQLQDLEEQASQALATIDRDFSSRAAAAKQSAAQRPTALPAPTSQAFCGSAKRMTVSSSREQLMSVDSGSLRKIKLPQSEARMQAITWLETSERNSERDSEQDDGRKVRQAPGSASKVRVQSRPPVVRVANSAAAQRARGVRQAYETLGVDRNINDSALDRVYAALLHRENPENNPADCAGYYANKTKEIRAAYSCVRANRRPGQSRAPQMGASDMGV
jgi:hypothetical protein